MRLRHCQYCKANGRLEKSHHEVEASHKHDQVNQYHPVSLEGHLSLSNKCRTNVTPLLSNKNAFEVSVGFWQAKSENDDENGRASAKPEKRTPAMAGSIYQGSRKGCGKEIPERIALLEHTRYQSTGFLGAIFQSRCRSITVQTTHCNTKQRSAGQELLVILAESSTEFKNHEQEIVDDEGPLASVPICGKSEDDGSHRSEHQHQCYPPSDLRGGFVERCGESVDCQTDSEEIERIPSLRESVTAFRHDRSGVALPRR